MRSGLPAGALKGKSEVIEIPPDGGGGVGDGGDVGDWGDCAELPPPQPEAVIARRTANVIDTQRIINPPPAGNDLSDSVEALPPSLQVFSNL
jgi:hypothetical protein